MAFQRFTNVVLNVSFKEVFLYRVFLCMKNKFNDFVKISLMVKSAKYKSSNCIYLKNN